MNESTRIYQWLYTTLSADPALQSLIGTRIFRLKAPELQPGPFIVYHVVTGLDVSGLGGVRIMTNTDVVVRAIGLMTQFTQLQAIADRIDAVLHLSVGTANGLRILACTRTDVVDYGEEDEGVDYHHIGGQYRLLVQPL